jgi:hypothetical protein
MQIKKLEERHLDDVIAIFESVIKESFVENGWMSRDIISKDCRNMIIDSVEKVRDYLKNGNNYHFYVVVDQGEVLAVGGWGKLTKYTKNVLREESDIESYIDVSELQGFYVKSSKQEEGVGSFLFEGLMHNLRQMSDRIKQIIAYTAYDKGIKFWRKKLGKPQVYIEEYFNDGADMNLWIIDLH